MKTLSAWLKTQSEIKRSYPKLSTWKTFVLAWKFIKLAKLFPVK